MRRRRIPAFLLSLPLAFSCSIGCILYHKSFAYSHENTCFIRCSAQRNLHLGNYLGALENWAEIQGCYESIFCIVDLHAITVYQEPDELAAKIRETAALFIAAGIDPKQSSIVVQSSVSGHAELAWMLTCVTPIGWLNRMTQFKAKSEKQETIGYGLLAVSGADGGGYSALPG